MHSKNKILLIQSLCSKIDLLMQVEVDEILHHPDFQALEGRWRALSFIAEQNEDRNPLFKLKLLCLTEIELKEDLSPFSENLLLRLIHNQEFDQAGGEPFGLLVFDYVLQVQDSILCAAMGEILSNAFCLALFAISPKLLGIEGYTKLAHYHFSKPSSKFSLSPEWASLQKNPNARFMGLCLGRVLIRTPYTAEQYEENNSFLCFVQSHYLYASVIIHSFIQDAWFHDLSNAFNPKLERLYCLDQAQSLNEVKLMARQTAFLAQFGLLYPEDQAWFNEMTFRHHPSFYKESTQNFKHSTESTLCISRFAHYLKIILRNKLNQLQPEDCEHYLQNWIQAYCAKQNNSQSIQLVKFPLQEARIKIERERTGEGHCCTVELKLQNTKLQSNFEIYSKN